MWLKAVVERLTVPSVERRLGCEVRKVHQELLALRRGKGLTNVEEELARGTLSICVGAELRLGEPVGGRLVLEAERGERST